MATTTDLQATDLAHELLAAVAHGELAATSDTAALAGGLMLVTRSAEWLLLERLQPFAGSYPATVQALVSVPAPAIETARDAKLEAQDFLGCADLIDMLCTEELICVAPRLHRGWQDKKQSCRQARRVTHGAVGFSIDDDTCESLLAALAIRNRLLWAPPPVQLELDKLQAALLSMLRLIERIAAEQAGEHLGETISQIRERLGE